MDLKRTTLENIVDRTSVRAGEVAYYVKHEVVPFVERKLSWTGLAINLLYHSANAAHQGYNLESFLERIKSMPVETAMIASAIPVFYWIGRLVEEKIGLSEKDDLTDLYNQRRFKADLPREIGRSHRSGEPLSLLALDLDHFKKVNDTYGHPFGDDVLKKVGEIIRKSVRAETDDAYRDGGEELKVILPETGEEEALTVAEKIRENMERLCILYEKGNKVQVTISIGTATYFPPESGYFDMLRSSGNGGDLAKEVVSGVVKTLKDNADAALYTAKGTAKGEGRNRVYPGISINGNKILGK